MKVALALNELKAIYHHRIIIIINHHHIIIIIIIISIKYKIKYKIYTNWCYYVPYLQLEPELLVVVQEDGNKCQKNSS